MLQEYLDIIQDLKQQLLEERRKNRRLERDIRDEVSREMAQSLVEIEETYSKRLHEAMEDAEEIHDKRIELLTKSIRRTMKRKRVADDADDDEYVSSVTLHAAQVKLEVVKIVCVLLTTSSLVHLKLRCFTLRCSNLQFFILMIWLHVCFSVA